jgi:hypothetical protein
VPTWMTFNDGERYPALAFRTTIIGIQNEVHFSASRAGENTHCQRIAAPAILWELLAHLEGRSV